MAADRHTQAYDFTGQTILITGGVGVLCNEMAHALFECGANVVILHYNMQRAQQTADTFPQVAGGPRALAVQANVLDPEEMRAAVRRTLDEFGQIDGLINGAGGNKPTATTSREKSFFDLPVEGLRGVFDLNLMGLMVTCQVVGKHMAERKQGVILNISSMSAFRPLTGVSAYSAAKAAAGNFTQWLATHMALEYSPNIRVNAIAPGFFITEQNRFLMTDKETGRLTERGEKILKHIPMGRLGKPEDLIGTMLWLMSPASAYVTGIIVPVDGGFSAYSGV